MFPQAEILLVVVSDEVKSNKKGVEMLARQ